MEVLWEERKMVGHEAGEIDGARSKRALYFTLRKQISFCKGWVRVGSTKDHWKSIPKGGKHTFNSTPSAGLISPCCCFDGHGKNN